jgi:glycosyltransferase involved in cell wall biosynthesis
MMAASSDSRYTVVIPAYNAAETLEDAIRSVLDQTLPPASIVVADDASTDATVQIAQRFGDRIVVISHEHGGPAIATDRAMALVNTPFVAGLDHDDLWLPDKAARQLARLAEAPELDAVFCRAFLFRHRAPPAVDGPSQDMWGRSAMMMRTSAARRIGPLADTGALFYGDMIAWLDRGRRLGLAFELMPQTLVGRRIISSSMTFGQDPSVYLSLLRQRIRDRRG